MNKWVLAGISTAMLFASIYASLKAPYVEPELEIEEVVITDRAMTIENVLPLERTVLFVGLEGVPQLLNQLLKPFNSNPVGILPKALDPKQWKNRLDMDPRSRESWPALGLEPDKGLYLARIHLTDDFRQRPKSIYFLPTTEPGKVLDILRKWDLRVRLNAHGSTQVRILTVQDETYMLGERGGYTTLLHTPSNLSEPVREEWIKNYDAFLSDDGPRLATHAHAEVALNSESGDFGSYGILNGSVLKAQLGARGQLSELGQALLEKTPMAGLVSSQKGTALRCLASPPLDASLIKIFGADSKPSFARYVPRTGWTAARISLNLKTLLSGLSDSLPPSMTKQKFFLLGLPTVMKLRGFPYDELIQAFDGHVLLMVPSSSFLQSIREKPIFGSRFLYVASLADTAAADAFISGLKRNVLENTDRQITPIAIGERTGIKWTKDDRRFNLIRVGETLFFGTHLTDIESVVALKESETLAGSPAGMSLDDAGTVFSMTLDFLEMESQLTGTPDFIKTLLTQLKRQNLSVVLRKGLEFRLQGHQQSIAPLVFGLWAFLP